jgi:hypothetical protein
MRSSLLALWAPLFAGCSIYDHGLLADAGDDPIPNVHFETNIHESDAVGAGGAGGIEEQPDPAQVQESAPTSMGGSSAEEELAVADDNSCVRQTPVFDVDEFALLDNFNTDWPRYNEPSGVFSGVAGEWTSSSNSADFTPQKASSVSWESASYGERECLPSENLAFRAASADAQWISVEAALSPSGLDLSGFTGLILYARSPEESELRVTFLDGSTSLEVHAGHLGPSWEEIRVPFVASPEFDPSSARALKFLVKPEYESRPVELWLEDVAVYR